MNRQIALIALVGSLTACSPSAPAPLATTVCDLSEHAQRAVQIDATVSVDTAGNAQISDSRCPAQRIALRLSTAATRAGADAQLQSAARQAVSTGKTSFSVRLSGVYMAEAAGSHFVADSVAIASPH